MEHKREHITDMAGKWISPYDIGFAARTLDRKGDHVLLCRKETCLNVDRALETAPRNIIANTITTKWGNIDIVQKDDMPEGSILIMTKQDYADQKEMAENAYLIRNIGPTP